MSVKVKICGIRTIDAAKTAVSCGAHFLGFNFGISSRRYIDPSQALKIIDLIRGKVNTVGVFQNAEINHVNKIASDLQLDLVQLHGSEDNEYIQKVDRPVIKSVTLADQLDQIKADYLLLDRIKRGKGKMVDFTKAVKLAANFRMFIAGGLNPNNVAVVIKRVGPFAVDVANGVETNGEQDIEKIKLFIKNAREAI